MQTELFNNVEKGAVISDCGLYRYQLWRIWDNSKPKVLFIMLNPSTANADQDDPTIRRCIGFAKSWGYGGLYVGNLFAYRSTKPKGLYKAKDPVGPENHIHLIDMKNECKIVVCAWGNEQVVNRLFPKDLKPLRAMQVHYLELSVNGAPKHPLYLKSDLKPLPF